MQFRRVLSATTFHRRLLIVGVAVGLLMTFVWLVSAGEKAPDPATTVNLCGSSIDVHFFGETNSATRTDLMGWIHRAGDAVCTYYGKFPVPHLGLDVRVRGAGVHGGVTYARGRS